MTDISLRKMNQAEFSDWQERSIAEYAKDKQQSLGIGKAKALQLSQESYSALLPDGLETPDNLLFVAVRGQQVLGWLWFKITRDWGVTSAFVYDLEVRPEHRRQGVASAVMRLLEDGARQLGACKIALHVFGQNTGARDLYAKAGYRITDYSMAKDLT